MTRSTRSRRCPRDGRPRPDHGRARVRGRRHVPGRRGRGGRAGARRPGGVARSARRVARRALVGGGRPHRGRRRAGGPDRLRRRQAGRRGARRGRPHRGDPALRRLAGPGSRRASCTRTRPAGRSASSTSRAAWPAHHPVELPGGDPGVEARPGAAGRQRGVPQARAAGDADRRAPRRAPARAAARCCRSCPVERRPRAACSTPRPTPSRSPARRRPAARSPSGWPGASSPLQLEMGGKNGVYVSADADPAQAATIALAGAMGYAGQKCTATCLLFVHERAADAVRSELDRQAARSASATRARSRPRSGRSSPPSQPRRGRREARRGPRARRVDRPRRRGAGPPGRVPRPHRCSPAARTTIRSTARSCSRPC